LYVIGEKRMHEVSVQEFHAGDLVRRIDAAEASWDGREWVFSSGFLRSFQQGNEQVQPFDRTVVPGIRERPEDFAKESRRPGEMSYSELRGYVEKLRASGSRVSNYLVDLHLKLAFPLVNFIVVLIGPAVAPRLHIRSAARHVGREGRAERAEVARVDRALDERPSLDRVRRGQRGGQAGAGVLAASAALFQAAAEKPRTGGVLQREGAELAGADDRHL